MIKQLANKVNKLNLVGVLPTAQSLLDMNKLHQTEI